MKKRVDEVLKAGAEWQATAEKLTKALEELTKTIQRENRNLKPIKTDLKKLSRETKKLAGAFNNHRQTLVDLMERI